MTEKQKLEKGYWAIFRWKEYEQKETLYESASRKDAEDVLAEYEMAGVLDCFLAKVNVINYDD